MTGACEENEEGKCLEFFVSEEEKENCHVWFDGCNLCSRNKPSSPLMCTKRFCKEKTRPMCRSELQPFNCQTKEVWTEEKRDWCCKNRKRGCSGKIPALEYLPEKKDCQVWFDGCNTCARPNRDAEFSCGSAFCAVYVEPYCKKKFKEVFQHDLDCSKGKHWAVEKARFCCRERDVGCPATCKSDMDCYKGKVCSKGIIGDYCMTKGENIRGSQNVKVVPDHPELDDPPALPSGLLGLLFFAAVVSLGYLYYVNNSKAQGKGQ